MVGRRIIACLAALSVASSLDPCMNLQVIRDVSRTTDYSLQPLESPGCDFIEVKWYRYLNNEDGLMATSCPSGSECGTLNQVWMNDSAPGNGCEKSVEVCIRHGSNCCERKSAVRAKNCGQFMIYKLIPLPGCSRYCYGNTTQTFTNITDTQTDCLRTGSAFPKDTSTTISFKSTSKITKASRESVSTSVQSSSSERSSALNDSKPQTSSAVIVGASVGGAFVGALLATGVTVAILRHRRRMKEQEKQRTYETIEMESNAVENVYYSIDHSLDRDSHDYNTINSRTH